MNGEENLIAVGNSYAQQRVKKILLDKGYIPPVKWAERSPAYLRQVLLEETVWNNPVPTGSDIRHILISLASLDDENVASVFMEVDKLRAAAA